MVGHVLPQLLRRISRAEYDRMVELGMFSRERIELLHGVLVTMSPIGSRHAEVVSRLQELLTLALHQRARVRVQCPLAVTDDSEPEPDLAVVALRDYSRGHPDEAALVIEVADTSLDYDLGDKAGLYAQGRVREYWVVDLKRDAILVHRAAGASGWEPVTVVGRRERLAPMAFPDVALAVDEILG